MNAIQQLLTEHIDIWTGAETAKRSGRGRSSGNAASVYGIKKLRELILELAVRGKLVPQDANEEPASELLRRIQAEKAKLIADGKIKKEKPFAPISEGERPFKLPKGWEWVRNCQLFQLRKGRIPKNLNENGFGLPYLDIEALDRNFVRRYSEDVACPQSTEKDILVVCDGSRSGLVLDGKIGIIGSTLSIIDTPTFIQVFIKLIFKQGFEYFNTSMKGAAIPHLDIQKLLQNPTALPPLAEQNRIIAKVEELMALCEQLETQHNNAAEAHEKLVSHLLGTLTQSQNADDFSANWQCIYAHFDVLFTTQASIDALKQTLLQLAVMGKLVPQDPNDEPASELLKRIQAEKIKLIAEGKLKKEKALAPISEDEKPFELPKGWVWARFPELGEFGRGKSKHRPRNDPKLFNPGIYPLVQTGEVARANGVIGEYHSKYSEVGLAQSKLWPAGTLCITIAANIADSAMLGFDACFPDSVVGFVPCKPLINSSYFLSFMKTARENLLRFAPATAQKNINLEILESVLVPVPPLKEIIHITARVDELMSLCDQLKTRIQQAGQQQQLLADVLVARAVA
jgi:type I restriction enzyme S subunit